MKNQALRSYLLEIKGTKGALYYDIDNFGAIKLEMERWYTLKETLSRIGYNAHRLFRNPRLRVTLGESIYFGMKLYRKDKVEAFMQLHTR